MTVQRPLRVFLVAGEESGDQLGGKLIEALRRATGEQLELQGVGGAAMARAGLTSLFDLSDIAVMGILPVIARLPTILDRIRRTAEAVVAAKPDVLVIIDSPDFTHRVARQVRRHLPDLPVVDYVSPSVWAWRPGRAKRMRAYVDHVLALLPFEPEAHLRLGGPDCTYVGHPLIERLAELRPAAGERAALGNGPLKLVVLPGSRRSEIERLTDVFGDAVDRLRQAHGTLDVVIPTLPHLAKEIAERTASWSVAPRLVQGEAEKLAAFRSSQLALAASGTVTLELALSGVPMVVGYKVSRLEAQLRHLLTVDTVVLPNLILGRKAVPELLQWDCKPDLLAEALRLVAADGPSRQTQIEAFAELDGRMTIADETPSGRAARIVMEVAARRLSA